MSEPRPPADPFRPDEPPGRALELAREAKPATATLADLLPRPRRRERARFRRPARYSVVLLVLATVGFLTVSRWVVRKLAERAPGLPAVTELSLDELRALLAPALPEYTPAPPEADAVLLDVRVQPRDARLLIDGHPAPSNPVRLPRGQRVVRVVAHAPGHLAVARGIVPDADLTLTLRLRRVPEARGTGP